MTALQFIRKYDLQSIAEPQRLKFGFSRYAIRCSSWSEYESISTYSRKNMLYAGSHFNTMTVFIMNTEDHRKYSNMVDEENRRVNDWWERYHKADEMTRRLMASGAIA